jgi:hypothetical protein
MTDQTAEVLLSDPGRGKWKALFWLAFLLPMVPTLVIYGLASAANSAGCMADPMTLCRVGPLSIGDSIRAAMPLASGMATAMAFGVPIVLAIAYVGLELGYRRLSVRLLLALLACVVLAYLPIVGPSLALESVTHPGCQPNESGIGECNLFGVSLGQSANTLGVMGWFILIAGPVAFLTFLAYFVIALILRARAQPGLN